MPSYEIRRATPADKPAIFQFLKQAYPQRWQYKCPERWEWAYEKNPHLSGNQLPIWIALTGAGDIVGQSCSLVETLAIGNRVIKVAWGVDLVILEEHRRVGLGTRLKEANVMGNEVSMSMAMAGATKLINGLASV